MNHLERAKEMLGTGEYTLVICSDAETKTSTLRGVAPLMKILDAGETLSGCFSADKVVGKGAAYLYILLRVEALYAQVLSKPALDTLKAYRIPVTYGELTNAIENRDHTGFCPIETAVLDVNTPGEALSVIRETLKSLKKNK